MDLAKLTTHHADDDLLYKLALGVASVSGQNVFESIVRYLAETLEVDLAFVGRVRHAPTLAIHTIAVCIDGQISDNLEYDPTYTPCSQVIGRDHYYIREKVAEQYPGDNMLSQLALTGYAGAPLNDSNGRPLGVIAVLHRAPLPEQRRVQTVLSIFAARAAAELERLAAEEASRQLEVQLRQAQKMQAIGHLAGGIAHDFNNILTSLMGYVTMVSEALEDRGEARLTRYLQRAGHSGQRARDLIQQLLTFSRGQRGEPRPVFLAPLITEAMQLLTASLPSSVVLRSELEDHLPPVLLDPVQVEQVLMNLCINAADAMQGRGELTIQLRRHQVQEHPCAACRQNVSGDYIELAVSDAGSGIAPEVLERMFEPFYTTKEVGKGSGMGLATVHGIVHEHGGHILVDSTPGAGATFRVLFPPLQGAAAHESLVAEAAPRASRRAPLQGRVLVVDDEPAVSEFMQDLLSDWGLQVSVINQSPAARDAFAQNPDAFDAVLLDQTMPGLTGLELAQDMLLLRPALPVLLYTGYREALDETLAKNIGVRAIVRKPVDAQQLHGLFEAVLAKPAA